MIISERELTPLVLNPPPNITRVNDEESEAKLFKFLYAQQEFGYDVETTVTKDFYYRRVRTKQFGNANEQYVIDLKDYCDGDADLLYKCQGNYGVNLHLAPKLKHFLDKLSKYLCSNQWLKVGVNLGFEYQCNYWNFGYRIYGLYDCMLAEKCLYAGLGGQASLKNYEFYSMESLFERYFGNSIDKTLQTSFNLEDVLSTAQEEYAALDTRLPLGIKRLQTIIASGWTPKKLKAAGKPKIADCLYYLDDIIFGDNLNEVIQIENDAIGAFVDMHVHGERINREKWKTRVQKSKEKLVINLQELDKIFLPIVGSKNDAVDDAEIDQREAEWKALGATPTDEEIKFKLELKQLKRECKKDLLNMDLRLKLTELEVKLSQWEQSRKVQKDILKKVCGELKKKRTKINKLQGTCEGEALINYGSDAQLLHILRDPDNYEFFPKLFILTREGEKKPRIESMDDETLEEYSQVHAMKLIQEYHGLSKDIGTYGDAWATEWITGPSKEEGWLHPGDGRLHSTFNQYDAATGRSSSSQPNGQNIPQDKEVRSCFISDPPDENIRISDCCHADCNQYTLDGKTWICGECFHELDITETHSEDFSLLTIDMSGAELRILAEEANDPIWIKAFKSDEDVHSVCTEMVVGPEYWKKIAEEGCAYFKVREDGEYARKKCKCVLHNELRNGMKPTNFGLPYGIGPAKLSVQIKKSLKETKELMATHKQFFPNIWEYLEISGTKASQEHRSFDMFGRRRLLPEPTRERAIENCQDWDEKKLRLSDAESAKNIETFIAVKGRNPKKNEELYLTHRPPTANEISHSYFQLSNSIIRQGKNHRIQSTNATIIKLAMGSGYDKDGKPYLFHILTKYKAKLVKMVHDELVIQAPARFIQKVAEEVADAIKRAAATKMTQIEMLSDPHISTCWEK